MTDRKLSRRAGIALALTGAVVLAVAASSLASLHLRLVSRTSNGNPASGDSATDIGGTVSSDGRFVGFDSSATNLPQGDGTTYRAYVTDMATGKPHLVSRTSNGQPATGDVYGASLSANGRFVAFWGYGDGLPGANGTTSQVWLHDRKTGKTRLASKADNGNPGNYDSGAASVSADGRFVSFQSQATNLPGGGGPPYVVYVRDLKKGRTFLVSKTGSGDPAYGDLDGQSISSSGRFIVFGSNDAGLPSGDDTTYHIYRRDLQRRRTKLVDRNSAGQVASEDSDYPSIARSGRFVAFDSYADNLPGGTVAGEQSYLRDLRTGKTKLVSRNNAGQAQNAYSYDPHVSGDGRYVVFDSYASNLPQGDGVLDQIYVRDVVAGKTRLLSRASNGDPANAKSRHPSLSLDGDWAAFDSAATNLGVSSGHVNVYRVGRIG